ncbi:MAG: HD domain-containing protein [Candidatus Bathyarchaeota archaeon]|nr:HD domain-containing protein [Candidatus Bathyarchaeota archaeon]
MPKAYWGEIKDPVHGYVYITEAEKHVIDSYPMQRLRRLRQLAGSEYVYPGANHTRFEHSVGVMYLAGNVLDNPHVSQVVNDQEIATCRIAALLHDIGHGPFSHVFEHLLNKNLCRTHEDNTSWLIEKSEVGDELDKLGFNRKEVAALAVGKMQKKSKAFLNQIISSAVDVDKMDFIVRDTYHTGAEYGFIDVIRLIHAFDVMGENLAVELGALSALEAFIIARIESFKSIYFHRVGRAAQIMLASAMDKANPELGLTDFKTPEEYLALDDYTVWAKLKQCKASQQIISNLEHRKMLKCAYERTFYEKDDLVANLFGQESYRNKIRVEIAKEAGIPTDMVNIDVPTVQSVPYHPTMLMQPMEIPVFNRGKAGEKKLQRLSETSKIFETLRGFMNILRVYTNVEEREKVEKATAKILGKIPSAAKISF